jgi:hypothetical protein
MEVTDAGRTRNPRAYMHTSISPFVDATRSYAPIERREGKITIESMDRSKLIVSSWYQQ